MNKFNAAKIKYINPLLFFELDNKYKDVDKILSDYEEKLKNIEIQEKKKIYRKKSIIINFKKKVEDLINPEMSDLSQKLTKYGHQTKIETNYNEFNGEDHEMPFIRFYAIPRDRGDVKSLEYRVAPSISFYLDVEKNKVLVKSDYLIGSIILNSTYDLDNIEINDVKSDMTNFIARIFKL